MNRLFYFIVLFVVAVQLTGCTSTHVRVQMVLNTSTQQLQDDSPAGRKALVMLQILTDFRQAEIKLTNNYQVVYLRQSRNAEINASRIESIAATNAPLGEKLKKDNDKANQLLGKSQKLLNELETHVWLVDTNIQVFSNFFMVTNAIGLAPRVEWESLKARLFLGQEMQWLHQNFKTSMLTNLLAITRSEGKADTNVDVSTQVSDLSADVELAATSAANGIIAASHEGFGGFVNVGVAEINPADPEYRRIFGHGQVQLSLDSFSESRSDISGDANAIIVQESAGQFRTYQISNDPSTLVKNISLLVSKATAAAAKYLSGGIAP